MKPFEILLIYNIISLLIIICLLIICVKTIKKQNKKDIILKITSIAVIIVHYSSLYLGFFKNQGNVTVENTMLLPIYPCNIIMWLLLIVSFSKNKETKVYKLLSEFTCFGGTICGLIGSLFNVNFLNNPDLLNYNILKGLIGHSIMIFGTAYLFVFKYVKFTVSKTMMSVIVGELIFTVCGFFVNTLFAIFNVPPVNAMFMLKPPFKEVPLINFYTIMTCGLIFGFISLLIFEFFAYPKEERWINNLLRKKIN